MKDKKLILDNFINKQVEIEVWCEDNCSNRYVAGFTGKLTKVNNEMYSVSTFHADLYFKVSDFECMNGTHIVLNFSALENEEWQ